MTTADWARQATPASARIPDEELAEVIRRAAAIGVPAWRVATALGVPVPSWAPVDELPAAQAMSRGL